MKPRGSVAVIGAGISGLTAGWKIHQLGHDVRIFESADRVGGVIRSGGTDGFLAEGGPNSMLVKEPSLLGLIEDLGLMQSTVEAGETAKKRFIVRGGRPVAAPISAFSFLATKLFSGRAKCRLLMEPFIRRSASTDDESLADFVIRRLGREVLDYAVGPFVSGVYAGDAERLSVRYAFPRIWELERNYGSLISGGIRSAHASRKSHRRRMKSRIVSFREGMERLPAALHRSLGDSVILRARLHRIARSNDCWDLTWREDGRTAEKTRSFDSLIVTVPAFALSALPFEDAIGSKLRTLDEIEYPPVSVVVLGFRREDVRHRLDGFGMLSAPRENLPILGTLFSTTMFPDRAPPGHVTLTTFVGGSMNRHLTSLADDRLREIVMETLERLLGVTGDPIFYRRISWDRAIPQYNLGYGRLLEVMDGLERTHRAFYLAGSYLDGIALK